MTTRIKIGCFLAYGFIANSWLQVSYPSTGRRNIMLPKSDEYSSSSSSSSIRITDTAAMFRATSYSSSKLMQTGDHSNNDNEPPSSSDGLSSNTSSSSPSTSSFSSLDSDSLFMEQFRRRRGRFELKAIKDEWQRPPNPFLSPQSFVSSILAELRHPRNHHSGVLALLESSTDSWHQTLSYSVGAPTTPTATKNGAADTSTAAVAMTNHQLAPTLETALGRPNNQFAILLGVENSDYVMDFPSDPLDYGDGTCWLECRLRCSSDDELLVATGWSLKQRSEDGAWLIDALDWQDFRELYRPGIGREEWERICG